MEYTLEIINMERLCRICLTDTKNLHSLNSPLTPSEAINIKDGLETLMNVKIVLAENYPSKICETCLEKFKNAYELRQHFINSDKVIRNLYGDLKEASKEESATVDIIVGENKYNLKDLVIVENAQEEKSNFNGFLKNLGKTVSVSFTKQHKAKMKEQLDEKPNILIEKIDKYINDLEVLIENEENVNKDLNINIDDYITDLDKLSDEEKFILNLEHESTGDNTIIIDQDLLESALNKRFECETCHKVYSNKTRYKTHLLTCLKFSGNNTAGFPCKLCNKIFKDIEYLKIHIKDTHKSLQQTCEICNVTFKSKKRYMYHKNCYHSDQSSICDFCGKKFVNKSSLKEHRMRHVQGDDAVQCICPICGKTFNYRGGLFYHMKIHNGERNYACKYCDRRFYSRVSIDRHEKTHTGIRPYECNNCNKRFFSKGELRKHLFTHTGFSSYQCQFCDKYFCSKFNLDIHLTFYRGEYLCKLCNRGFISKTILKFHEQRKHKSNKENNTEEIILEYEAKEVKTEDVEFEMDYLEQYEEEVY